MSKPQSKDPEQIRMVSNDHSFYTPLDSSRKDIRILVLHPGTEDEDICCGLVRVSLAQEPIPQYNCLSYCWGSLHDTRKIKVYQFEDDEPSDDETDDLLVRHLKTYYRLKDSHAIKYRDFNITLSLYGALRRRKEDARRMVKGENRAVITPIWADAVCINQSDLEERAQQVQLMREIYAQSSNVLVWMGDESVSELHDPLAMGAMLQLTEQFEQQWGFHPRDFIGPNGKEMEYAQRFSVQKYKLPADRPDFFTEIQARDALARFMRKRWFNRLWVAQEVLVAKSVVIQCGGFRVPWASVVLAMIWLQGTTWSTGPNLLNRSQLLWMGASFSRTRHSAATLLLALGSWQTTDPRDKIYALLGLIDEVEANGELPAPLRPNYEKAATTLYSETIRWIIEKARTLKILGAVELFPPRAVDNRDGSHNRLSSWVPSFQNSHLSRCTQMECFSANLWYRAFGKDAPAVGTLFDPQVLSLEGFIVDEVGKLIPLACLSAFQDIDEDFLKDPEFLPKAHQELQVMKLQARNEANITWETLLSRFPSGINGPRLYEIITDMLSQPIPPQESMQWGFMRTVILDIAKEARTPPTWKTTLQSRFLKIILKTLAACGWVDVKNDPLGACPSQEHPLLESHFAAWCKFHDDSLERIPPDDRQRLDDLSKNGSSQYFEHTILPHALGQLKRQFLFTLGGFFGLCPNGTQVGDLVCVFKGGSVFYVLRKHEPGVGPSTRSPLFKYIGECYLHTLMHGNIRDDLRSTKMPSYLFHLY